jgi:hypothetical protein
VLELGLELVAHDLVGREHDEEEQLVERLLQQAQAVFAELFAEVWPDLGSPEFDYNVVTAGADISGHGQTLVESHAGKHWGFTDLATA